MHKPHIYIIIALCVLCIGFGAYGYYSGRKAGELDREIGRLRSENEKIRTGISRANTEAEKLNNRLGIVARENRRLTGELTKAHDGSVNITTGLKDLGEGISGVLQEMYAYAEKNNPPD